MKITIESTSKIVSLNGIPARIWEGETENGINVHFFISSIAVDRNETHTEEFNRDLQEVRSPSAEIAAYPMNLIL